MNSPCIRTTTDLNHVAKVIAARRALCVGEGFRLARPVQKGTDNG